MWGWGKVLVLIGGGVIILRVHRMLWMLWGMMRRMMFLLIILIVMFRGCVHLTIQDTGLHAFWFTPFVDSLTFT